MSATTPTPAPSGNGSTSAISDPIIAALVEILKTSTSPDMLSLRVALIRRLLLQGDVSPSRIPSPRNITEIGGYINLLTDLGQTTVRTEALSSALGVAPPQVVDTIMNGSQNAPSLANPANPLSTSSMSPVMSGLGVLYTPSSTGRLKVTVQGTIANSTAGDGGEIQISFGTGPWPANGNPLTGTQAGNIAQSISPTANNAFTVTTFALITNLTVGTQYWFDLAYGAINGGNATVSNITMIIEEF
ncbi:MAG: hypothetical protein ACREBS_00295 [Nitrososphaerales archaeon]